MSSTEIAVFGGQGVALSEHARMTTVGLQLAPGASEQELLSLAEGLGAITDATCFAIGDIANFYKAHFPREYREWIDRPSPIGGLDQKTVKVYAAVSAFFPHEQRARHMTRFEGHPGVSFSHFSRVRRYGAEKAEYWLSQAAEHGWSLQDMESRIESSIPGTNDAPELPETPETPPNSFHWIGPAEDPMRHLLFCGDATNADALKTGIEAMLGEGGKATMMWTDPPYGVDYVGKVEGNAMTIQNDARDQAGLRALLRDAWTACATIMQESAPFYVAGPTDRNGGVFITSFENLETPWRYFQMLVWVKQRMILGHSDYHLRHEAVYYGYTPGRRTGRISQMENSAANRSGEVPTRWFGPDNCTSVIEVDAPSASREHPTMKPVELITQAIENSSVPGDVVFDPFAGSGSTLIAADLTDRRAFVVELDPRYADVIRQRYPRYRAEREQAGYGEQAEAQPEEGHDFSPGPLGE